jgi:hypothetical protein
VWPERVYLLEGLLLNLGESIKFGSPMPTCFDQQFAQRPCLSMPSGANALGAVDSSGYAGTRSLTLHERCSAAD